MSRLALADSFAGYVGTDVLRAVTVAVSESEWVGLLGPNGAGKSTVLKAITGQLRLRAGRRTVGEEDARGWRPYRFARAGVRWVGEPRPIFPSLSVAENLAIGGITRRADHDALARHVYDLMPVLYDKRTVAASQLSGGQQQMLAIGQALMSKPRFLCLDEPSLGLAPAAVAAMTDLIHELVASGVGVLWAEQYPEVVLGHCSSVVVLSAGTVVRAAAAADVTPSDIESAYLGERSYEDAPPLEAQHRDEPSDVDSVRGQVSHE
jgi:ABC-type branched-subunit amino acid transport system ATPase component